MNQEARLRNCPWPQDTGDTGQLHVGAWMGSWNGKGTVMDAEVRSE